LQFLTPHRRIAQVTEATRRAWIALAAFALALAAVLLLAAASGQPAAAGDQDSLARVVAVQERHTDRLLARAGVVGTAVGGDAGAPVVRVFTARRGVSVTSELDGVPVLKTVTGPITAAHHRAGHSGGPGGGEGGGSSEPSRTATWPRPVPIGISTGRADECAAGTIGARVKRGSTIYALSNNHVYAKEATQPGLTGTVLQPGRYDLNCAQATGAHHLGTLTDYVPLSFGSGSENRVDAAIAATDPNTLRNATPSDGYGTPRTQTVAVSLGQRVQKYGRTTGLTRGQVQGINAAVNVGYSSGTARFVDQVVVYGDRPGFLRSGDSGSLLVTDGLNPAGLLFASDSSGRWAFANPIGDVLGSLNVTVDGQ
jgi:hypothetical protein